MSLDSALALSRVADSCGLPHDAFSVLRAQVVHACRRGEAHDLDADVRAQLSVTLASAAAPLRAALRGTSNFPGARPFVAALPAPGAAPTSLPTAESADAGESADAAQVDAFRRGVFDRLAALKSQVTELAALFANDSVQPETCVWALKLKGDLHRYVAEASASERDAAAADAAFAAALAKAVTHLPPTSPLRLGAALNYATFLHDVLRDVDRARRMASDALDEAEGELHSFDVPQNLPDTAYVMQLTRRALAKWAEPS